MIKLWDVRMVAEITSIASGKYPANKAAFDTSGAVGGPRARAFTDSSLYLCCQRRASTEGGSMTAEAVGGPMTVFAANTSRLLL